MTTDRRPWTCERIAELIPDYLTGLMEQRFEPYPGDDPGAVMCKWTTSNDETSVVVGVTPEAVGESGVVEVREGRRYDDGLEPFFLVVDTERLRTAGAAAVSRDDSDPVATPWGLASVIVNTPFTRFNVSTIGLDWAIEIGTRLAEND
ncbi:hypothetical protein [Rhodococcus rhodnii]|uniref:hypothetical protein n=1 Tax=Rhodococcus rhodnii TaxID=38312 RepID=UPI000B287964|nr:hypothetical protein [Rhodococcus rhodnii]